MHIWWSYTTKFTQEICLKESSLIASAKIRHNVRVAEIRKEERKEEYKGFEREYSRHNHILFICKGTRRLLRVYIVEDRDSEQRYDKKSTQRFCP